jgi:TrmH family RNA methyltransferase
MQPLSKAKLKLFSSLKTRKFRQRHQMFVVEGWKMLDEALQAGWLPEAVVLREDIRDDNGEFIGEVPDEKLFYLDNHNFDKMSSLQSPEGVLAVLHIPASTELDGKLPKGHGLLLEQIQDPGNLGTLMRIADWFGLAGLVCSSGTVDVFNPKTLRASMGAIFRVPVHFEPNWEQFIDNHRDRIWIADMEGKKLASELFDMDDWVLLGNEANGVSESVREMLHERRLTIPGRGGAESLNVAVAGGIIASYWV